MVQQANRTNPYSPLRGNIDLTPFKKVSKDAELTWLEKGGQKGGATTHEQIADALDEYSRLFKAGIASNAEKLTLARAFPDTPTYVNSISDIDPDTVMVVGGPASVEMVDREGHLITTNALSKAFDKYMENFRTRNAMVLHSDVQVGWALPAYITKGGQIFKSGINGKELFFITELRGDTKIADRVSKQIDEGKLRSYSIAGSATKVQNMQKGLMPYMQVDDMELAEVTVCEKGVNQGASFQILKAQTGKISKEQCGYRPATDVEIQNGIMCGTCKFFNKEDKTCDTVDGLFEDTDYCKLFEQHDEDEHGTGPAKIKIKLILSDDGKNIDFNRSLQDLVKNPEWSTTMNGMQTQRDWWDWDLPEATKLLKAIGDDNPLTGRYVKDGMTSAEKFAAYQKEKQELIESGELPSQEGAMKTAESNQEWAKQPGRWLHPETGERWVSLETNDGTIEHMPEVDMPGETKFKPWTPDSPQSSYEEGEALGKFLKALRPLDFTQPSTKNTTPSKRGRSVAGLQGDANPAMGNPEMELAWEDDAPKDELGLPIVDAAPKDLGALNHPQIGQFMESEAFRNDLRERGVSDEAMADFYDKWKQSQKDFSPAGWNQEEEVDKAIQKQTPPWGYRGSQPSQQQLNTASMQSRNRGNQSSSYEGNPFARNLTSRTAYKPPARTPASNARGTANSSQEGDAFSRRTSWGKPPAQLTKPQVQSGGPGQSSNFQGGSGTGGSTVASVKPVSGGPSPGTSSDGPGTSAFYQGGPNAQNDAAIARGDASSAANAQTVVANQGPQGNNLRYGSGDDQTVDRANLLDTLGRSNPEAITAAERMAQQYRDFGTPVQGSEEDIAFRRNNPNYNWNADPRNPNRNVFNMVKGEDDMANEIEKAPLGMMGARAAKGFADRMQQGGRQGRRAGGRQQEINVPPPSMGDDPRQMRSAGKMGGKRSGNLNEAAMGLAGRVAAAATGPAGQIGRAAYQNRDAIGRAAGQAARGAGAIGRAAKEAAGAVGRFATTGQTPVGRDIGRAAGRATENIPGMGNAGRRIQQRNRPGSEFARRRQIQSTMPIQAPPSRADDPGTPDPTQGPTWQPRQHTPKPMARNTPKRRATSRQPQAMMPSRAAGRVAPRARREYMPMQNSLDTIVENVMRKTDFTTLANEEARQQEHDQLIREYGFPSEMEPEAGRYIPVIETETNDKGIPINNKGPWVVNEAGQDAGEINDEDAPNYSASEKAKNTAGEHNKPLKKSWNTRMEPPVLPFLTKRSL